MEIMENLQAALEAFQSVADELAAPKEPTHGLAEALRLSPGARWAIGDRCAASSARIGRTVEGSPFEKWLTSLLTRIRKDTPTVSMTHLRRWRGGRSTLTRTERRERRSAADPSLRRLIVQLVAARYRAGLTQEQIAWKLGTKKSAISRLESGFVHRPNLTTIENYALVVGCRVDIVLRPLP